MDDFGMLARDFGFRAQGKSAPMKSSVGSDAGDRRNRASPVCDVDHSSNRDGLLFDDVFGGPPKYSDNSIGNGKPSSMSDFDYDSIFKTSATTNDGKNKSASSSTLPVYDKPVYDEDIFNGLPGLKSKSMSSSAKFEENVSASMASTWQDHRNDHFDDLLGNLGPTEKAEPKNNNYNNSKSSGDLDDLLPAFGSGSPAGSNRLNPESSRSSKSTTNLNQTASTVMDDPFVVLESTSTPGVSSPGMFTDPLEEFTKLSKPRSTKADHSFASGGAFDDIDPLHGFGRPAFSSDMNNRGNGSPLRSGSSLGGTQTSADGEHTGKSSSRYSGNYFEKKVHVDNFQESHQNMFDVPTGLMESQKSFGQTASSPPYANDSLNQTSSQVDMSSSAEEQMQASDDIWLTVSEIHLFTQPTNASPPSRPPPPIPRYEGSFASNARKKADEFSSPSSYTQHSKSTRPAHTAAKGPSVSSIDELEDFAMGRSRKNVDENADFNFIEENSAAAASAAAMKEAMDRAEAKFRQAKEVREREYAKAARSKDAGQQEKDDIETQEREYRENQERLDRELRQREENEIEQRILEERERERERERGRRAVERATREARERAAAEARERAAREKAQAAERAAVEKALSEARERAERAAVLRAQAEARERASAEARERAEKAAQEKANLEAKEKEDREQAAWEKAAVERAATEARRRAERAAVERAAAEARERAAAAAKMNQQKNENDLESAAKMNQQKNENDLESFFSMGSRPSSAPRPRASSSDPLDPQSQGRGGNEGPRRTSSSGTSSNIRKASSTTNIVDDLTSIFGVAASSGEFQEFEGETEERRKARLERHQRTQERAAKALAEKNQRDLQTQREQEERHRISETLDIEIKRWAAGKEGNLRALLSTLQYVLWPECGWQPVSLTDLITGASVKKVYRKATLCIHPDKVQQKGATLQQKYIAEKVFDLLKEAWNKFNSEELF